MYENTCSTTTPPKRKNAIYAKWILKSKRDRVKKAYTVAKIKKLKF